MDSSKVADIVIAILHALKDWPLISLVLVGLFSLVAIPIVMTTKRWLDHLVPDRNSRMITLAEHNGALLHEVEQWRETAEKAMASQRALIEQATNLDSQLADTRKRLTAEPVQDSGAGQKVAELERQLSEAQRQLTDARSKETDAVGKWAALERQIAELKKTLEEKSRELQERDVVAQKALAGQRALIEQTTNLEARLADTQAQLAQTKHAEQQAAQQLHEMTDTLTRFNEGFQKSEDLLVQLARVVEDSIETIFVQSDMKKVPTLDDVLALPPRKVLKYSVGEPQTAMLELKRPADEIRIICTWLHVQLGGCPDPDCMRGSWHIRLSKEHLRFPDFSVGIMDAVIKRSKEFAIKDLVKPPDNLKMGFEIKWTY